MKPEGKVKSELTGSSPKGLHSPMHSNAGMRHLDPSPESFLIETYTKGALPKGTSGITKHFQAQTLGKGSQRHQSAVTPADHSRKMINASTQTPSSGLPALPYEGYDEQRKLAGSLPSDPLSTPENASLASIPIKREADAVEDHRTSISSTPRAPKRKSEAIQGGDIDKSSTAPSSSDVDVDHDRDTAQPSSTKRNCSSRTLRSAKRAQNE